MYEKWIYQFYNISFTSLPIMWYAIFDLELPRVQLIKEVSHYRLGMFNECFDFPTFWLWILYGFMQAFIALYLSMVFPVDTLLPGGKTYGFWAGGHMVYFLCVLIVNGVILKM